MFSSNHRFGTSGLLHAFNLQMCREEQPTETEDTSKIPKDKEDQAICKKTKAGKPKVHSRSKPEVPHHLSTLFGGYPVKLKDE